MEEQHYYDQPRFFFLWLPQLAFKSDGVKLRTLLNRHTLRKHTPLWVWENTDLSNFTAVGLFEFGQRSIESSNVCFMLSHAVVQDRNNGRRQWNCSVLTLRNINDKFNYLQSVVQTSTDDGQELMGVIYPSERRSVLVVNAHVVQAREENVIQ